MVPARHLPLKAEQMAGIYSVCKDSPASQAAEITVNETTGLFGEAKMASYSQNVAAEPQIARDLLVLTAACRRSLPDWHSYPPMRSIGARSATVQGGHTQLMRSSGTGR